MGAQLFYEVVGGWKVEYSEPVSCKQRTIK